MTTEIPENYRPYPKWVVAPSPIPISHAHKTHIDRLGRRYVLVDDAADEATLLGTEKDVA